MDEGNETKVEESQDAITEFEDLDVSAYTQQVHQEGRGHWAVNYNSPQSFLIRWLNNFGDLN